MPFLGVAWLLLSVGIGTYFVEVRGPPRCGGVGAVLIRVGMLARMRPGSRPGPWFFRFSTWTMLCAYETQHQGVGRRRWCACCGVGLPCVRGAADRTRRGVTARRSATAACCSGTPRDGAGPAVELRR